MAPRMTGGQLALAAVAALVGLYAVGNAYTWLDAMLAEGATLFIVLSVLAIVGALGMAAVVPIQHLWRRQPAWAKVLLPVAMGVGGICAAICLWFVAMIQACAGVCEPVHTWKMFPAIVSCGALSALGPLWAALGLHGRPGASRWWIATALFVVAGLCVALFCWVELGLYPNS